MGRLEGCLEAGRENRVAIGHFNVSDLVRLKAVFTVAQELKVPVLIGVSEGERQFIGVRVAKVQAAARSGFDLVVFDASKQRSTTMCGKPRKQWKRSNRST